MFSRIIRSAKPGLYLANNRSWNSIGGIASITSLSQTYKYENLKVELLDKHVVGVTINRPEKRNALNKALWADIKDAFDKLSDDPGCRSIVFSGGSKIFSAGIDLTDFMEFGEVVMSDEDIARKCLKLSKKIESFQDTFNSIEKCRKPVICAVHGPCIGAGVDCITATDIRYCTIDSWFQVKEVDVGLAADVGTLQRLPRVLGSQSLVNELCLTCRPMPGPEALQTGLVSRLFNDHSSMMTAAVDCARSIADKSPVAVQSTKMALVYSRDHSVMEGLHFMRLLNMSFLQSEDLRLSTMSQLDASKEKPKFQAL